MDGTQSRGEPLQVVWKWLERPGPGAWVEAWSEQGLAGMIYWCPGGALLAQLPVLRCDVHDRWGCDTHDHR